MSRCASCEKYKAEIETLRAALSQLEAKQQAKRENHRRYMRTWRKRK